MNITNNIIYINNDENDQFSRKVGQNIIACNKIANKIANKTNSIEIEFLSDNLNKIPILEQQVNTLTTENETLRNKQREIYRVDITFDDATEHSIITRPKFSLESLGFDETLGKQAIWMWDKVKLYGNTYYYELSRYVVSSLDKFRPYFEDTLSQDGYAVASTFDTTFIGETKKITSLYLSLPIVNNYAFMMPWMDVTISDSTTALLILSSLQFNPAKSDDPYQNIVGW